jgi:hypothetical protein
MAKHRVKTHRWFNGTLETLEHFFETIEDAYKFIASANVHITKIYDETNSLVHSMSKPEKTIESSYSGTEDSYSGAEDSYSGADNTTYA